MADQNYQESDPRYHTSTVKTMLDELINHLREDTGKFNEPKAQAMFETSAEVLLGIKKAFDDYEKGSESAMKTRAS